MIDAENHRNKLFETYEFSVIITGLPEINKEFRVEHLKVELWEHIRKIIKKEK